jgi:hypothetical protein
VFYLAYHLHWSWPDVLALDLGERREYVRRLAGCIDSENRALDERGLRRTGG